MIFVITAVVWIGCIIWAICFMESVDRPSSWAPSKPTMSNHEMQQNMEKAIFDANVQTEIWKSIRK